MRKLFLATAVALLVAPVAALADTTPAKNASQDCTALRAKMGATPFTQAFGTFGSCVSKMTRLEQSTLDAATALCQAEQADPNFASTHGGQTFTQFYGKGASDKNAFANCVTLKTRTSSKLQQTGLNPSRACSALRTSMTRTLFAQSFGTNANHRNAFGKCVSLVARAQSTAILAAATACLAEANDANFASTHDGKTFQQFYGTNSDLSNAFGNCVLKRLTASTTQLEHAVVNAARSCKALKRSDPSGFRQRYGSKPNAFGKCVASKLSTK